MRKSVGVRMYNYITVRPKVSWAGLINNTTTPVTAKHRVAKSHEMGLRRNRWVCRERVWDNEGLKTTV